MGFSRRFFQAAAVASSYTADFLVVAGGGSGGMRRGSGGGAGGLRTSYGSASGGAGSAESPLTLTPGTTYTISVGNGGNVPAFSSQVYVEDGEKGEDSSIVGSDITNIVSEGGGGGMSLSSATTPPSYGLMDGGSGAGASAFASGSPGRGESNQGRGGGDGCAAASGGYGGGGAGGGAMTSGGSPSSCATYSGFAAGGNGLSSSITGSPVTYAEGGDAPNRITPSMPAAPTANTGSGGCGGSEHSHVYSSGAYMAKAGADGVVILRVPTASYTGTVAGSPSVTTHGTDTIIKWTGDGSYTA